MTTTTLLVPTLNEAVGVREIMPRIDRSWVDQILVVDGNSTDGTPEILRDMGYDVVQQRRKGVRHAYTQAMNHVHGDIVITFSPDGNCIPEHIPLLIEKINEGYDMVVASRYLEGAESGDDSRITGFGNWLFTTAINRLHGGSYTDAMNIFRAWRRTLFTELAMDKDSSYWTERLFFTVMGCEPLLSVRAAKRHLRVAEIPSPEPPRIGGKAKLQVIRWGGAYMTQLLVEKVWWR